MNPTTSLTRRDFARLLGASAAAAAFTSWPSRAEAADDLTALSLTEASPSSTASPSTTPR
jgi:hypothetical protein